MDSQINLDDKIENNLVNYYIFSSKKGINYDNLISDIFIFLSKNCHLDKYIWQSDSFSLKKVSESALYPAHLHGSTYYGDNIEDEWYIVYMLMEVSKKYDDIIIRIVDEDGEFLLIEAADSLPSWLDPDVAENRVYIHRGGVHIVEHGRDQEMMTVRNALKHIEADPNKTMASKTIQADVQMRFKGYPDKISEMKHSANCYVPANLSALLDVNPTLISSIVCAFYERDSLDLKSCVTFKHFQPGTRVMRRVQMTKCQYAQLMQQKFHPDPQSGYNLPHVNSQKFKACDLGAKLAHGAEILCGTGSNLKSGLQSSSLLACPKWQRYHKSLIDGGYFKDELEGSKLYEQLLSAAKSFYMTSVVPHFYEEMAAQGNTSNNGATCDDDDDRQDCKRAKGHIGRDRAGSVMLTLLGELSVDIESLRMEGENLEASDDDGWMDIGPEELDEKLSRYSRDDEATIDDIPKKIKSFVSQKSSHLGVELPERDSEIFFEPGTFMANLQKVFDFEDPKSSSSDSELDEYDSESDEEEKMTGMDPSHLKSFMDMMDQELASSKVGKSFISEVDNPESRNLAPTHKTSWATWDKADKNKNDVPSRPPTFNASVKQNQPNHDDEEEENEDDEFKPVDVDMNLVQNFLKSYSAQLGMAGPSSIILNSLGLSLPPPDDDDETVL